MFYKYPINSPKHPYMTLKRAVVTESKGYKRPFSRSMSSHYRKIIGHFLFKMFRKGNFILFQDSPQSGLSCRPVSVEARMREFSQWGVISQAPPPHGASGASYPTS